MKNDSTSNYAMARVYRTAVAVSALILSSSPALAADLPVPRGNVSVNLNPTTGYFATNNTTLRLPDGVRATPFNGVLAVTKYPGGLKQSIPTGITIDAIKKTAQLPVTVRASNSSLKTAAKGLFKGGLAGVVLTAGLQQLLDSVDWVMDEGGKIQKIGGYGEVPDHLHSTYTCNEHVDNPPTCSASGYTVQVNSEGENLYYCAPSYKGELLTGLGGKGGFSRCLFGGTSTHEPRPVADADIDTAVDDKYIPDPSDWRTLAPHLGLDDIEIAWAPTLQGEPKTTTEYDADGKPHKIRETNIWYDFDIRDNPSPKPKLDVKKRVETKTYTDGVLTGTTTTKSTEPAASGGARPPPPESPIDCDLFPTACAWFNWTKEEPVEPDDDLRPLLQEVPIVSETYTITGGVAACPAPLVLDLSVFGSREVSYQPLCDLASTMKYLYLALMSFAAAVLLHRSINRV